MIRIYGYYSCGGYKDMYLGNSDNCGQPSFFLPLLPIMKKRKRPDDLKKIEELEKLLQIRIITDANSYDFPIEGNIMFSHGGYIAIYRTLSNGNSCLSIRDIPNSAQDEEGRNIPFNILFVADSLDDILLLDKMAMSLKENFREWMDFFSTLFSYDAIVNGIKFDLPAIFNRIKKTTDFASIKHMDNHLVYLMLDCMDNMNIALREQMLQKNHVSCVIDTKGTLIYGSLPISPNNPFIGEQIGIMDNSDVLNTHDNLAPKNVGEEISQSTNDKVEIECKEKPMLTTQPVEVENDGSNFNVENQDLKLLVDILRKDILHLREENERLLSELQLALKHMENIFSNVNIPKIEAIIKELKEDKSKNIDIFPFNTAWFKLITTYRDCYLIAAVSLIILLLVF